MPYGATRDDPLGWGAIAQGRNAQDPMGWAQIAAQQQQGPNLGGLPPELLYLIAGELSPSAYAQGGMEQSPADQYLSTFDSTYLDPAMEEFAAAGGMAQNEKYWNKDIFNRQKFLAGLATDRGEAEYDIGQDQFKNQLAERKFGLQEQQYGLAEQQNEREALESRAEFGDPEADWFTINSLSGITPQELLDDLSSQDPDKANAAYDSIATILNLTDDNGNVSWRTGPNLARVYSIIERAQDIEQQEQAAAVPQQPDMATRQDALWAGMTPGRRAREVYMQQQGQEPTPVPRTVQDVLAAKGLTQYDRPKPAAQPAPEPGSMSTKLTPEGIDLANYYAQHPNEGLHATGWKQDYQHVPGIKGWANPTKPETWQAILSATIGNRNKQVTQRQKTEQKRKKRSAEQTRYSGIASRVLPKG